MATSTRGSTTATAVCRQSVLLRRPSLLRTHPAHSSSRRGTDVSHAPRAQEQVIIVCTNSGCRKKGGATTLKLFQDLSPDDKIKIVEQNCLDECPMGPNCGIDGDFVKVVNRVKTKDDVVGVLRSVGVEPLAMQS